MAEIWLHAIIMLRDQVPFSQYLCHRHKWRHLSTNSLYQPQPLVRVHREDIPDPTLSGTAGISSVRQTAPAPHILQATLRSWCRRGASGSGLGRSFVSRGVLHIALILARMPRGTTMVALTATLLAGEETTKLLKTLGLVRGAFFVQRRSNARHDVQDIYRVLRHGLSSWSFSDPTWIFECERKP